MLALSEFLDDCLQGEKKTQVVSITNYCTLLTLGDSACQSAVRRLRLHTVNDLLGAVSPGKA